MTLLSSQALYLGPLLDLVRRNDGTVYPQPYGRTSLTLMIDVKVTPQQTAEQSFDIIHSILTQYAGASCMRVRLALGQSSHHLLSAHASVGARTAWRRTEKPYTLWQGVANEDFA